MTGCVPDVQDDLQQRLCLLNSTQLASLSSNLSAEISNEEIVRAVSQLSVYGVWHSCNLFFFQKQSQNFPFVTFFRNQLLKFCLTLLLFFPSVIMTSSFFFV